MAGPVDIEGGEEDFCRLLLGKGLVAREALEALVKERRVVAAGGAALPPLAVVLQQKGFLPPDAVLKLRSETQAFATCDGCRTFHAITYFVPGSSHACRQCSAPLRARAVASGAAAAEESLAGSLYEDESLLDLGTVKPKAPPPPPPPPAALPAEESLMGVLPGGGETLLGMDPVSGKPKEKETKILRPDPATPPAVEKETKLLRPKGGETTLLDLDAGAPKTPAPPDKAVTETAATIVVGTPSENKLEPTIIAPLPDGLKVEPTILADVTPRTRSDALRKTDSKGLEVTPRTGSGGARSFTPTKAAPKEVQEAAKDAQRIFGKYVLVKELGRGGAGVVYKAWDTTLAQYVALKFIRDQDMGDTSTTTGSQAVTDFQREARMSAKLRHPNIIRIYELGCMSDRYYLSMDYIEGGSLFEVIHDGKDRNTDTTFGKDPKKFLEMMRKICEAVDSAHKHDPPVIHRDIKPHNVLVATNGTPYVVDFGLAKEVDITSTQQNTMTGVVKGTPSYMAPEQAEGRNKEVDARTDVYSLGAVLYELITGRPPFQGGSVREVLNAICTRLPDRPNEAIAKSLIEKPEGPLRPRPVPKPLETICMKALEKASADRYQSAKDLADDLGRFLKDEDILAQEPSLYRRLRRGMRQHPLVTGAIAAVLCCGIAIGGVLKFIPRTDNSALLQLESAAEEHLKASDWAAMKVDAGNLRALNEKHPLAARIDKALAAHAADLAARRKAWSEGLARLATGALPAALDGLRAPFRQAGELKAEFADPLERALFEIQAATENQARELIGGGRREEWLDPKVKSAARTVRERIGHLQALAADPDFPFKPSAQLAVLRAGLEPLLAYEGLWDLRVNVAPYARLVLRRGATVVAEEWTPAGFRGLDVAAGYTLELAWPAPEKPDKKVSVDLKDLKHGAKLVLSGDMTKADVKVQR